MTAIIYPVPLRTFRCCTCLYTVPGRPSSPESSSCIHPSNPSMGPAVCEDGILDGCHVDILKFPRYPRPGRLGNLGASTPSPLPRVQNFHRALPGPKSSWKLALFLPRQTYIHTASPAQWPTMPHFKQRLLALISASLAFLSAMAKLLRTTLPPDFPSGLALAFRLSFGLGKCGLCRV